MQWWKLLAFFVRFDIKLMPCRLRIWRNNLKRAIARRMVDCLGWILGQFGVEPTTNSEEILRLERENRRKIAELMSQYAKANPGSTVHDFNAFFERASHPPFFAPRFLLATIIRGSRFWEE